MSIYGKIQDLENKIEAIEEVAYARNVVIFGARTEYTEITGTYILASTALTASKANITSELTASRANITTALTATLGNFTTNLTASRANITNELTASKTYFNNNINVVDGAGLYFLKNTEPAPYGEANTRKFSHYENGTWVPRFVGNSTAGIGSYSTQYGTYTKIGNTVFITCKLVLGEFSTAPVGDISIRDLPYVISTNSSCFTTATNVYFRKFNTAMISIIGLFAPTTRRIDLYKTTAASVDQDTRLDAANLSSAGDSNEIVLSGFYFTDE
jgi:hypothetical protein